MTGASGACAALAVRPRLHAARAASPGSSSARARRSSACSSCRSGMSLMGDGIGHVAVAGVAAGLLLDVWPIWTALVVAVVGAVLIEWLRTPAARPATSRSRSCFYGGIARRRRAREPAPATGSVNVSAVPVRLDPHRHLAPTCASSLALGVVIVVTRVARRPGAVRDRARRGVGTRRRACRSTRSTRCSRRSPR